MTKNYYQKTYSFDISIARLDDIIAVFFVNYLTDGALDSPPKLIAKIGTFMNLINRSIFDGDEQMLARFALIDKLYKSFVEDNLRGYNELYESVCTDSKYQEKIFEIFDAEIQILDETRLFYLDKYLGERIQYTYIFKYKEEMQTLLNDLDIQNFESLSEINSRFKKLVENASYDLRNAENVSKESSTDFGNGEKDLREILSSTITNLSRSSSTIKTGIKWLNNLLDGGYKAGRVYLWMGVLKGWKSGMLLNTVLWGKEFNMDMMAKDPKKRPCILYVTMENSTSETLERIWSYYIGEDDELAQYTVDEAFIKLQKAGFNSSEGPYIEIKYRRNKSINTLDLASMIDELAERGLEVTMLVQDYIKRINPIERNQKDLRLELGDVVNDFVGLAKERNIVIVTANQLNREAMRALEEGGATAMKKIHGSQAGESMLPMENADWAGIVAKTMLESTEEVYINIKEVALRFKKSKDAVTTFAHPMENGMKLREDVKLAKSLSVKSLGDGLSDYQSKPMKDEDDDSNTNPSITKRKKNKPRQPSRVVNMDEDIDMLDD